MMRERKFSSQSLHRVEIKSVDLFLNVSLGISSALTIYIFIFSRKAGGYMHFMSSSWHCLHTGESPLHFVFRVRHEAHARGTRLWCRDGALVRCRGIAILELRGTVPIGDLDNVRALEDGDVRPAFSDRVTLLVDKPSLCPTVRPGTCGGISGMKMYWC
jgi:hypothetical protein